MQTAPRTRPGNLTEMNAPAAFAAETSPLLLNPVNRHRPFAGGNLRNSASAIGAGSKRRSWPFGTAPATVGLEVRKPVAWPSLTLERLRWISGAPLVAAVDVFVCCLWFIGNADSVTSHQSRTTNQRTKSPAGEFVRYLSFAAESRCQSVIQVLNLVTASAAALRACLSSEPLFSRSSKLSGE